VQSGTQASSPQST